MDQQRIIILTRLAKEYPGDRVQQGRFPGAIVTRDAGQVKAGEIQVDRVAVREETRKPHVKRDHPG